MAFRKLFTKRLFDSVKTTVPPSTTLENSTIPPNRGVFRRFLPRRAVYHSGTARLPEFLSIPVGEKLREKLHGTITGDRIKLLDFNFAPATSPETFIRNGISVEDAKKILKVSQMEKVKTKLRNIPENSVSYSEFLRICVESCENHEQGVEFAKLLDESGNVIVLGNVVFLRPEQVAKSIESIMYQSIASPNDPRRKELEDMKKLKAMIDGKAKAQVQTELYFGLGFLTIQTIAFMRLTFWELSWDVMEPICFFVTSLHFAFAYLFFIRTSTEPTFQGYFHRRFITKQERLMKTYNFDANRYQELCKACYPSYHVGASAKVETSSQTNQHVEDTLLRA